MAPELQTKVLDLAKHTIRPLALRDEIECDGSVCDVHEFTADEAKEAFIQNILSKRSGSTSRKDDFRITKVVNASGYRYVLETQSEGRKLAWKHEPYKGQPVPKSSAVPGLWEIKTEQPDRFTNGEARVIIPETKTLCSCYQCDGVGSYLCGKCHGNGKILCVLCHPEGITTKWNEQLEGCYCCRGQRSITCFMCHGSRYETCCFCDGYKYVVYYVELTINCRNLYKDEHFVEWSGLPEEVVAKEKGLVILYEESKQVFPIRNFIDDDVCIGSTLLIGLHGSEVAKKQENIILQRHWVTQIPAAEVHYMWGNQEGTFHMYGTERNIFMTDEISQKTCCVLL